jgi:hypothetical protein
MATKQYGLDLLQIAPVASSPMFSSASLAPLTFTLDADTSNGSRYTSNPKILIGGLEPNENFQYQTSPTGPWLTGQATTDTDTGITNHFFILAEGQYAANSLSVRRVLAGNLPSTEVFTNPLDYTIDKTPPPAATLSLHEDSNISTDSYTKIGQIDVNFEEGGRWEYSVNGRWKMGMGKSFTLTDGVYEAGSVLVRQYDKANNLQTAAYSSNAKFTVDTKAPTGGALTLAEDTGNPNDGITTNGKVLVTFDSKEKQPIFSWDYSTDGGQTWTKGVGSPFDRPKHRRVQQ